jgi:hypothetical protein
MRRRLVPWLVVLGVVAGLASPASAGGNWLEFREADPSGSEAQVSRGFGTWAVLPVGQDVIAATGIYVPNPHRRDRLEATTFYVWLSPGGGFLRGTRMPDDAVRLAPFAMHWSSPRAASVRAQFVVPDVPSGEYEVLICDDPCTLAGFGQYVQGWITVKQTAEEARLFALARDRKWDVRMLRDRTNRLQGDVLELESDLGAAEASLAGQRRSLDLAGRFASLGAADRVAAPPASRPLVPGWAAVALGLAIVVAALVVTRRRRSEAAAIDAFIVPDTVPDELLENAATRDGEPEDTSEREDYVRA